MLSDPGRNREFKTSEHWKSPLLDFRVRVPQQTPDGRQAFKSNSFSGNERNRLVMRSGKGFVDRSLVSGIDCKEDARSFAMLDFDGDGWLDIALASVNGPRLRLFRNRFGDLGETGRVVEVTLQGSQTESVPTTDRSNRDGIGAIVTAISDEHTRVFRKSIGEGLAAQNSERIRITLAKDDVLKQISVRWPSGKTTDVVPQVGQSKIEITE